MGVTRDGIVDTAEWVANPRNGGGTYDPEGFGYPWRIVLHTIEGSANRAVIASHPYPPHLWYDPPTRKLYQTVPLSRSAFALWQAEYGHYTNRARALQVEISGRAAEAATWPQAWLDAITEDVVVPICQWVAQTQGASINLAEAPDPGPIAGSASEFGVQRISQGGWALFSGLCSHRHVPTNDHWDTGGLDTPRIAAHARLTIAGLLAPSTQGEDEDMPDYLLKNGSTGTVVARYPQGALRAITYHEFVHLTGKNVPIVTTDAANWAGIEGQIS